MMTAEEIERSDGNSKRLIDSIRSRIRADEHIQARIELATQEGKLIGTFTIHGVQEIGHFKSRATIAGIHLEGVSSEISPH